MNKLRILVAGGGINTTFVLKHLSGHSSIEKLYSIPYSKVNAEISEAIDFKENDIKSIINFVMENKIDLTIITSPILVVNGIANIFEQNGLLILSPTREAALVTYFNGAAKKTMYKLKIPTTRFAIFDKLQTALPYLRQMKFPVAIAPDFKILTKGKIQYKCFSQAKQAVDDLFYEGEERIVVEETPTDFKKYNLYFLTDGYSAYLLSAVEYDKEITIAPSPSLPINLIQEIKNNVILRLLEETANFSSQYSGIIGVNIIVKNNIYRVTDFFSDFKNNDLQTILQILDDDILKLIYSTATGSLGDEYQDIKKKELYACSVTIDKIYNSENEDCILFTKTKETSGTLTAIGTTVNDAKNKLTEILSEEAVLEEV